MGRPSGVAKAPNVQVCSDGDRDQPEREVGQRLEPAESALFE